MTREEEEDLTIGGVVGSDESLQGDRRVCDEREREREAGRPDHVRRDVAAEPSNQRRAGRVAVSHLHVVVDAVAVHLEVKAREPAVHGHDNNKSNVNG